MKKIILSFVLGFLAPVFIFAQKFIYVDTEYILQHIPSYKAAKEKLDQLSVEWQKEIEKMYEEIDKMYKDYRAEKVLLTEDMRIKRENEIIEKEKKVKELQKKRFGKEGDLYKKRKELIKPIQDKVFNAIKEIAIEGNYAIVFDKASSGASLIYTDAKFDKSDEVLERLGYKE